MHERRISTESLRVKLKVPTLASYADRRLLTWLGKIARMADSRMPKQLLFSWMDGKRKRGAQANLPRRARGLIVQMITECVEGDKRQDFEGVTECTKSEFTIGGVPHFWKDYNNWIEVADDETRWSTLVRKFTDLHSGVPEIALATGLITSATDQGFGRRRRRPKKKGRSCRAICLLHFRLLFIPPLLCWLWKMAADGAGRAFLTCCLTCLFCAVQICFPGLLDGGRPENDIESA